MASGSLPLDARIRWPIYNDYTSVAANTWEYAYSFTVSKAAIVRADVSYTNIAPTGIAIAMNSSTISSAIAKSEQANDSSSSKLTVTALVEPATYYVWVKYASANKTNKIGLMHLNQSFTTENYMATGTVKKPILRRINTTITTDSDGDSRILVDSSFLNATQFVSANVINNSTTYYIQPRTYNNNVFLRVYNTIGELQKNLTVDICVFMWN